MFTAAWGETHPVTVYANVEGEEEEDKGGSEGREGNQGVCM